MRRFCETLGLGGYFAGVSFVLWDTRCGIPLESVGYSYGRYAWARLRGFLDPYAVYVLWTRGLLTRWGLCLFCWGFAYCPKCGDGVEGVLLECLRPPSAALRLGGGVAARLWAFC